MILGGCRMPPHGLDRVFDEVQLVKKPFVKPGDFSILEEWRIIRTREGKKARVPNTAQVRVTVSHPLRKSKF
jgi:hypothetical protein